MSATQYILAITVMVDLPLSIHSLLKNYAISDVGEAALEAAAEQTGTEIMYVVSMYGYTVEHLNIGLATHNNS